jgi:CheY-like chemotaxis protein
MAPQEQKTILLVEDKAITAMAGAATIKRFGYQVIIANSGEEPVSIAAAPRLWIDIVAPEDRKAQQTAKDGYSRNAIDRQSEQRQTAQE